MRLKSTVMIGLIMLISSSCRPLDPIIVHDIYHMFDPDYSLFEGVGYTGVMDKKDMQQLNSVFEKGKSGRMVIWANPDTGNHFKVTPKPVYTNRSTNQLCRQAELSSTIDGQPQEKMVTGCRNAQGIWVVK